MAEAPNTNDELYPIAVLIDELKVGGDLTLCPPPRRALGCLQLTPAGSTTMFFSD